MSNYDFPVERVECTCRAEFDKAMEDEVWQAYSDCQQMLREVNIHWSGRPLEESVREAVDVIKNLRLTIYHLGAILDRNGDK